LEIYKYNIMEKRNQFIVQLKSDINDVRIITQKGDFPQLERSLLLASDFNESEITLLESFINMVEGKINKD